MWVPSKALELLSALCADWEEIVYSGLVRGPFPLPHVSFFSVFSFLFPVFLVVL